MFPHALMMGLKQDRAALLACLSVMSVPHFSCNHVLSFRDLSKYAYQSSPTGAPTSKSVGDSIRSLRFVVTCQPIGAAGSCAALVP